MQQAARVSRPHGVLHRRRQRGRASHRHARRVRPDRDDLHEPGRRADGGLRDGAVRMTRESGSTRSSSGSRWSCSRWASSPRRAVQRAVEALVERDDGAWRRPSSTATTRSTTCTWRSSTRILELLALQTPVAADLRLVSAILHSSLHLERIGDQAVNIAKIYLARRTGRAARRCVSRSSEMGDIVVAMLRTAMEAFARRDLDLCLKLPAMDDPVDRLNRGMHLEALKLADDPRSSGLGHAHEHGGPRARAGGRQRRRHRRTGRVPAHRGVPRVHRRFAPVDA